MKIVTESNQLNIFNQLLKSKNEAVCCYAARAVASIAREGCASVLIENLHHQDIDVVIDAISALGDIQSIEAIDILIDAVDLHPDGDVRVAAVQALTKILNGKASSNKLLSDKVLKSAIRWAMNEPIEQRLDYLWDDSWDIQLLAIEMLGRQQYLPAVTVLIELLHQYNLDIEEQTLKALVLIAEEGLVYVIALLKGKQLDIASIHQLRLARRAATALALANCELSAQALVNGLSHPHASVRAAAVLALGKRQEQQYVIDIIERLDDVDDQVKHNAISVITDREGVANDDIELYVSSEYLLTKFIDIDEAGRVFIYKLLSRIATSLELTREQLTLIHSGLFSKNSEEQMSCSQLISAINDQSAVPLLVEAIADESNSLRVKQAMLITLGEVADNDLETLKCIVGVLENPSPALRLSAIEALVTLAGKPAVDLELCADSLLFDYLIPSRVISTSDIDSIQALADNPQRIPLHNIDGNATLSPPVTLDQSEAQNIQAILANVSDDYPDAKRQEQNIQTQTVVSTLDSIQRDNITAFVSPAVAASKDDASAPHIREMVGKLPETEQAYADIVVDHLDSGEKVKLSRKKIAKMPDYSNKLLTIKALSNYPQERTVDVLLQQFLSDDVEGKIEAVSALTLVAEKHPKLKALRKTIGPLSTLLLSGSDYLRLVCARAIGVMRHKTFLPLLIDTLLDSDVNVRIQAIDSLNKYLSNNTIKTKKHAMMIITAVTLCLNDVSTGVVIRALAFLAENKKHLADENLQQSLQRIVAVGCMKEDYITSAANALHDIAAPESGNLLLEMMTQSTDEQQQIIYLQMIAIVLKAQQT